MYFYMNYEIKTTQLIWIIPKVDWTTNSRSIFQNYLLRWFVEMIILWMTKVLNVLHIISGNVINYHIDSFLSLQYHHCWKSCHCWSWSKWAQFLEFHHSRLEQYFDMNQDNTNEEEEYIPPGDRLITPADVVDLDPEMTVYWCFWI